MVLTGLYNMGEVPFREVYIHPKILDGYGETMTKSKGNGVDPLDVDRQVRGRRAAVRPGVPDDRDAGRADAGGVRVPALPGARSSRRRRTAMLPRIECTKCGKAFCTQWAEKPEDKALPRGAVVSERFELARNFCEQAVERRAVRADEPRRLHAPGPVADRRS